MTATPTPEQQQRAFPVSHAQQRLWFLDQLLPGNPAYNVPMAWKVDGPLRKDALRQALDLIVARHDVLRTTFVPGSDQPRQVVDPDVRHELVEVEVEAAEGETAEAAARRLAREEAGRPFDLLRGPLLRLRLLRMRDDSHVLLMVAHHIVFDGVSVGVFLNELTAAYSAAIEGAAPQLAPLPLRYGEYAEQQRQWERAGGMQGQLQAWVEQLRSVPPLLELPTDHPRPETPTLRGGSVEFSVRPATARALAALGRSRRTTPFMLLLAAFQTLVARYCGAEEVVVASPIAGRHRPGTEGLIGFFINLLPMRADFSGDPTFIDLLDGVRENCLEAYANADVPFERVVQELQPRRVLSWQPYAQVAFQLQHYSTQPLPVADLTLYPFPVSTADSKFEVSLEMVQDDSGLTGSLRYSTDLFERDTIERLAANFHCLLDGVARDPDTKCRLLPLVSQQERDRLLGTFNDPGLLSATG